MALEMRETCEKCGQALDQEGEAYVCSFECTFCAGCASGMAHRCPNCGGELLRRPRRVPRRPSPKAVVRRLHDVWNTGDLAAVPDVFAADFVAHFPASSELPERHGLDGVRRGIERIRAAFPDWHEDVEDIIAEGDRVVTRYTSRGTHRGAFWGIPPTGRAISVPEMSTYRVKGGKVAEQWCLVDELARMQQLGATLVRP